ncbi:NADH-ubiquinone dehydrogenase [Mesorhizobium sp. IMUNJ 23232]|uniref:NADH-ubiquinone dehydrogenase n=1 Tax=Mesorhizobium sp. IMUNJ 23232 TaxID=3376064 RepID=UPI0037AB5B3F
MSMFSDDLMPNGKIFDEMMKETKALMPAEFAGAVNMMAHPLAGMAAMSALGLGFASHAAGVWFGAMSGATAASQRMFVSAFDAAGADEFRDTARTPEKRAKATASLLIAGAGLVPVVEDAAPPRSVAEAKPAKVPRVVETPPVELEAAPEAVPEIKKPAVRKAVKEVPPVVEAVEPVAELQELAAAVTIAAEVPSAPVAEQVVPEGPRKPASIDKPDMPDDLKVISGIGPKLEQVLNGFGVWTYAQVAAWGRDEIAWVDDTLGFKGRIERDGWIEQAAKLAASKGA